MSYNRIPVLNKIMDQTVEHYEIAILGSGPAGYVGAIHAAKLGKKVCVIEKEEVGGTCLLHGCIPTKALLSTSELLYKIQHATELGLILEGSVKPDYPKIVQHKNHIVTTLVSGIKSLFKSYKIPTYYGSGYLKNAKTIEVTPALGKSILITADKLLIATGSHPANIPGFPFDGKRILSTTDILRITDIPKSLLILGAGASGCEFAFMFAELGSEVTVVEMLSHALPLEDTEISELLERQFRKRKIRLFTQTKIASVDLTDETRITAHLFKGEPLHAEKLLVSVGRTFNSNHIGLEEIGIKLGIKNEILINEKMETSIPYIYAAGDVTGKMMLAHVASNQAIIAVDNMCGKNQTMNYRAIPWNTFTHPPVSHVGLTEEQCVQEKHKIKIGRFLYRGLGAAQVSGELDGIVKIIADEKSYKILGVHILGARSTELIQEAVIAIENNLTTTQWSQSMHAHPIYSEAIAEALHDIHNQSIHNSPKTN